MLRYPFTALLAGLGLTLSASLFSAQAETDAPACGDHTAIAEALDQKYGEKPRSMGLASNGAMVEVYVSQKGTFTIVMTQPDGISCLVAAGEAWESLNTQLSDLKI